MTPVPHTTVGAALAEAAGILARAGVDSPRLDARLLAAHVLGIEPGVVALYPERPVSPAQGAAFADAVARRAAREPVSRIIGERGFWSLTLRVTPDTLDPRPDSETVVEAALAAATDREAPISVLDLGTGTGCLLLALLAELPRARGLGIDISPEAVAVARANAVAAGLGDRADFRQDNWGDDVTEKFDLIVSNPPYIADADIDALDPEVARFDPRVALAGGVDGLDAYRGLAARIVRLSQPGGLAFLEVGTGQAPHVGRIMEAEGLEFDGVRPDLSGIGRCVVVRVPVDQKSKTRKKVLGNGSEPEYGDRTSWCDSAEAEQMLLSRGNPAHALMRANAYPLIPS